MTGFLKVAGFAVGIGALIALGGWWEWSLWSECRADHSFWYCARVLNK